MSVFCLDYVYIIIFIPKSSDQAKKHRLSDQLVSGKVGLSRVGLGNLNPITSLIYRVSTSWKVRKIPSESWNGPPKKQVFFNNLYFFSLKKWIFFASLLSVFTREFCVRKCGVKKSCPRFRPLVRPSGALAPGLSVIANIPSIPYPRPPLSLSSRYLVFTYFNANSIMVSSEPGIWKGTRENREITGIFLRNFYHCRKI